MSVKACRICLATGVKLYSLDQEPLQTAIESIVTLNGDPSYFPHYTCGKCSAIIIKFEKMIKKSKISEAILHNIYDEHGEMTETAIQHSVNQSNSRLKSSITAHKVSEDSYIHPEHERARAEDRDKHLQCDKDEDKSCDITEFDRASLYEGDIKTPEFSFNLEINPSLHNAENATVPKLCLVKPASKEEDKDIVKDKEQTRQRKQALNKKLSEYFNLELLSHEQQLKEVENRRNTPGYKNAAHKCDKCYKYYNNIDTYMNHLGEHHPSKGELECGVCKKRFDDQRTLTRHVVYSHQRVYRCRHCHFVSKTRQALNHIKTHEDINKAWQCTHCDFVTTSRYKLSRHLSSSHSVRHVCDKCRRRFDTPRGLTHHLKRFCNNEDSTIDVTYSCEECALVFDKRNDWKKHLQEKHEENSKHLEKKSCHNCGITFTTVEELASHNKEQHEYENLYPLHCKLCDVLLTGNKDHWLHIVQQHPSEKSNYRSSQQSHLCDQCGRGFKSVTALRCHSLRHAGRRAVPCGLCPKLLYDNYQAQVHRNNVHSDARPHKCTECEWRFKLKCNLNRHMLVHTGERPHACTVCNKRFTQTSSRDLHVRTVHRNEPHPPRKHRVKQ